MIWWGMAVLILSNALCGAGIAVLIVKVNRLQDAIDDRPDIPTAAHTQPSVMPRILA